MKSFESSNKKTTSAGLPVRPLPTSPRLVYVCVVRLSVILHPQPRLSSGTQQCRLSSQSRLECVQLIGAQTGPTGAAGRGPRRKLPGTMWPSHIDRGPNGTRAVSGLRERWVGVRVKPEQAPQGATGRGLGCRSRGPQVDRRRSTILEQSCGRRTGGATVGLNTQPQVTHTNDPLL